MGQPTHFEPGRAWGVFAIAVPKDFGTKSSPGRSSPTARHPGPAVAEAAVLGGFLQERGKGQHAARRSSSRENGPEHSGPPTGIALTLNATVGQPLPLTLWAKDSPNTYDPEEGLPDNLRSSNQARGRGRGAAADPAAAAAARRRVAAPVPPNFDVSAAAGRGAGGRGRGQGSTADVTVTWKVHRGDKPVKFADEAIRLEHTATGRCDAGEDDRDLQRAGRVLCCARRSTTTRATAAAANSAAGRNVLVKVTVK